MSRLIPPFVRSGVTFGEARFFEILRNSRLLDDYHIFHSLNLISHEKKREGEADFVIVGPLGLAVLEVKSASAVVRKAGKWRYVDGERSFERKESPFSQAKGNCYALLDRIKEKGICPPKLKEMSGYGVVFTNLVFREESPEWEADLVLDENSLSRTDEYILHLFSFWRRRSKLDDMIKLGQESIRELVSYIRGDFECVESVRSICTRTTKVINSLTGEQYRFLEAVVDNPRLIVRGYAGTGKTLLAVEQAKRNVRSGEKVLLCCYNRLLGANLQDQLRGYANSIDVYNVDALAWRIAAQGSKHDSISELRGVAAQRVREGLCSWPKYGSLVIDEGQDLLDESFLSLWEEILIGGLAGGRWTIFLDEEVQSSIYSKPTGPVALRRISALGVKINLEINCRNPRALAEETHRVTGLPVAPVLRVDSSPQSIAYFPFTSEFQQVEIISRVVLELLNGGLNPNQITILFPHATFDLVPKIFGKVKNRVDTIVDLAQYVAQFGQESRLLLSKNVIGYSTIQAFKGLENDAVIVCDIRTVHDNYDRSVLYVGMTRARSFCVVVHHALVKDTFFKGEANGR